MAARRLLAIAVTVGAASPAFGASEAALDPHELNSSYESSRPLQAPPAADGGLVSRALQAPPDGGLVNIFLAIDDEYYLGIALCGMVRAFRKTSNTARRGRTFRFFVLHGPRLSADAICNSAEAALNSEAAARDQWTGCAKFVHDRRDERDGAARCEAGSSEALRTVNAIKLNKPGPALARVYRLSAEEAASNSLHCTRRKELVNLFNLAPDAVAQFLLPLGVKRALMLDADAWPERQVLDLYDAEAGPGRPVVALARWNAKCRSFTEGWRMKDPLVRATLGADRHAVDQKRFRASVLLVRDVEALCQLDVPRRVAEVLERQIKLPNESKMWRCGVQQPPLNLVLANHTALLGSEGRLIAPPAVVACDRTQRYVDPMFIRDDCKNSAPAHLHPRNETLRRIVKALVDADPDHPACATCETKYGRPHSEF